MNTNGRSELAQWYSQKSKDGIVSDSGTAIAIVAETPKRVVSVLWPELQRPPEHTAQDKNINLFAFGTGGDSAAPAGMAGEKGSRGLPKKVVCIFKQNA